MITKQKELNKKIFQLRDSVGDDLSFAIKTFDGEGILVDCLKGIFEKLNELANFAEQNTDK